MPRPRGRPKKIHQSFETVDYLIDRIPIQECIADPDILKKQFDEFSVPQQVVIKSLYGLPLETEEELKAWAVLQGRVEFDELGYPTEIYDWPYTAKKYNQMWAILGRRSGKALDATTLIPTTDGFKEIQQLQKGDVVFDRWGHKTKVVATTGVIKDRPCYRLTFSDGSSIIADAQHQWVVKDKNIRKHQKIGWLNRTTEELYQKPRMTGENNWSLPQQKAVQCPHKELPLDPYLLGAWLGDGTTRAAQITSADAEIVNSFRAEYPVSKLKAPYGYGVLMPFLDHLRQVGVFGNKHIPEDYLTASVEQRYALLQGLCDTDGYCSKTGKTEFYSTNSKLAEGVAELVNSLGGTARIRAKRATLYGKDCGEVFTVAFRIDKCPFRLSRKRARWTVPKTEGRYIASIEPVESVPVCCIQVEAEDGTYQAGREYIPTHNSLIASFIIVYEAFFGGHLRYVKKGQDVVIYFVAQKLDIARSQLKFIESFIRDSPILSNEVLAYNADNIDLKNGIKIVASSPSLRGQRGLAVPVAILDESGFYYSDPDAANPDVEVENAIKYAQAQFPDYLRLGISSPWTKEGLLWKYYQAGTQGEKLVNRSGYASVLVHVAPTAAMQNPVVTRRALLALRQEDAMSFERESLAKFVDSISGFLPEQVVSKAVVKDGKQFRVPNLTTGFQYVAAMDPAFRHDSFAFCIVHRDHASKIVLDAILKWQPRKGLKLNPADILNEISLWLNIYNIPVVVSDQYQLESLQQMALQKGWAIDGVDFTARSKSKIYGDLSTLFNTDRIVLIDTEASQVAKQLVEEISRLEKTQTSQGTVHISAPDGKHDDLASAFALAVHRALQMNPTVVEKKEEKIIGVKQKYLDDYRQRMEEKEYDYGIY